MRKITREEEFTLLSLSRAPLIRTQNPNPSEATKIAWALEDANREA